MAVKLNKGGNVSLTKEAGGNLQRVIAGLGWDERTTAGVDFDLDASALVLNEHGKVLSDDWFIFFNNLTSPHELVVHTGDDLTGAGTTESDDAERIKINLAGLSNDAQKIVLAVTIYEADERRQNFGQVRNAYVRVINEDNNQELVRYELGEDFSSETAVVFGELYRHDGEWKFRAIGQGYSNGLFEVCKDYGVDV